MVAPKGAVFVEATMHILVSVFFRPLRSLNLAWQVTSDRSLLKKQQPIVTDIKVILCPNLLAIKLFFLQMPITDVQNLTIERNMRGMY